MRRHETHKRKDSENRNGKKKRKDDNGTKKKQECVKYQL